MKIIGAKVEAVQPRQRLFHRGGVGDFLVKRFGVLDGEGAVHLFQPRLHPKEGGEAVQHVDIGDIIVVDVEGRLSARLQGVKKADLELLHLIQMGGEFGTVEAGLGLLQVLRVGQFPLPGGLRDLQADIAFQRVAGQHDLGTARVVHHKVEDARVVVVEIAKSRQAGGAFPHPAEEE